MSVHKGARCLGINFLFITQSALESDRRSDFGDIYTLGVDDNGQPIFAM